MPTRTEQVLGRMGMVTKSDLNTQVAEAFQKGYTEAYGDYVGDGGEDEPVSGTTAKYGYRRTTRGLRDFTQIDRDRILEIVWTLFQSNPVADRSLEIKRDYILGRGITYHARDDALQIILDDFWKVNKMDKRLKEFTLQLFLFGVQLFTVFIRNSDGRVRLGYIDPAEIEEVIPHPENAMEMWAVVVKSQTADKQWQAQIPQRVYRIVRVEENMANQYSDWLKNWSLGHRGLEGSALPDQAGPGSEQGEDVQSLEPFEQGGAGGTEDFSVDVEGKLVVHNQAILEEWEDKMLEAMGLKEYSGTVIYIRVNSVSNQPYGYSDLLQVADWLDQQDECLFALADREQWRNYFSWDVTLKGAAPDVVTRRAAEMRNKAPKRGTVNVHNEAEQWEMVYPSLDQAGSIETSRAIQNHVFGGLGFPEAWFGRGDETNRATLSAQGDPTWRTLEHDQDVIRDMILDFLYLVRDQAELAGTWTPGQPVGKTRMSGLQGAAGSSNGRLNTETGPGEDVVRGQEVGGVPDIGSKLAGKIIQDEVGDEKGAPADDNGGLDLDATEQVDPYEITVTMPEMTARDLSLVANMLSTIASALVVAEDQNWQDKAKSVEVWAKALSEFGIDLDVSAIQRALDEKEKEEELNQEQDPFGGSAMGRHGVMTDGETDGPPEWDQMDQGQRETLLEAFFYAVGMERVPEALISELAEVSETEWLAARG